jgi:fructose-1,6-bisphosphatase/inositol monophosphatase family enzyme
MPDVIQIDTPQMQFAVGFVKEGGELIRKSFGQSGSYDWKPDNTTITKIDIELNHRFIVQVSEQFPGDSILGEEESRPISDAEWTWVIDPLDGTNSFIMGMPLSTCCVALLRDGTPELGVLYDPFQDRLTYAQKGRGAFLNQQKITVSNATSLKHQFIHMDMLRTGNPRLVALREKLFHDGSKPISMDAIQNRIALTCAGRAAGVVFSLPSFWDVAAGYIIGTEAGAVVTDLHGMPQRYDQPTNGFILANPVLHPQLVALVKEFIN